MAEEKYLRQYEKSASGNYLLKSRGTLVNVISVTADRTLTQEESGSLIMLGANGVDVTLPACKAGVNFKVVLAADYDTAVSSIIQGSATEDFFGSICTGTDGTTVDFPVVGDVRINFAANSVKGDYVELISDGTSWFIQGYQKAVDAIAFA